MSTPFLTFHPEVLSDLFDSLSCVNFLIWVSTFCELYREKKSNSQIVKTIILNSNWSWCRSSFQFLSNINLFVFIYFFRLLNDSGHNWSHMCKTLTTVFTAAVLVNQTLVRFSFLEHSFQKSTHLSHGFNHNLHNTVNLQHFVQMLTHCCQNTHAKQNGFQPGRPKPQLIAILAESLSMCLV